ncbi:cytochrome c biogenesis protein CcdA [Sulfurovum sp. bin170]|uniref:cytochrome c biogenesis CcdA family protein n=1 Tax=Sulfurovum sp. bin170 TaxID=2695268 RepID=UPI0013DFF663|nr:cytochrome c biogenesis CcdA family protein [Sulfurovum sp. bin170]NEW60090.1 cytochrome c biogenesis protein CcdA [Sulfurovum sp. bin170]
MKLKNFLNIVGISLLLLLSTLQAEEMSFYHGNGCLHCGKVEKFLENSKLDITLTKKEIYQNSDNAEEFNSICDKHDIALLDRTIPLLYSQGKPFLGSEDIIAYIKSLQETNSIQENKNETITDSSKHQLTIPVLIGAAIVDAINPCAFAVLLILMTTIMATKDRRKALYTGLAFSAAIFLSYLFMGLGLYSVVASFETTHTFMMIIGVIAILIGLFNIKDYFWYGKGFLMEVPMSWRGKLKSLIKSVVNPLGAFFIGIVISLFLLPCTSGPYIVITSMLGHSESFLHALTLLILYNIVFILPMLFITIGVSFGLDINKAEELRQKNLQRLHLVAGVIMLLMGIAILVYYG